MNGKLLIKMKIKIKKIAYTVRAIIHGFKHGETEITKYSFGNSVIYIILAGILFMVLFMWGDNMIDKAKLFFKDAETGEEYVVIIEEFMSHRRWYKRN